MKYKTKLQRKKIYEKASDMLNADIQRKGVRSYCFPNVCLYISDLAYDNICHDGFDFYNHNVVTLFPELLKQKPKDKVDGESWWPKNQTKPRIKALKAAIKLCDNGS